MRSLTPDVIWVISICVGRRFDTDLGGCEFLPPIESTSWVRAQSIATLGTAESLIGTNESPSPMMTSGSVRCAHLDTLVSVMLLVSNMSRPAWLHVLSRISSADPSVFGRRGQPPWMNPNRHRPAALPQERRPSLTRNLLAPLRVGTR